MNERVKSTYLLMSGIGSFQYTTYPFVIHRVKFGNISLPIESERYYRMDSESIYNYIKEKFFNDVFKEIKLEDLR